MFKSHNANRDPNVKFVWHADKVPAAAMKQGSTSKTLAGNTSNSTSTFETNAVSTFIPTSGSGSGGSEDHSRGDDEPIGAVNSASQLKRSAVAGGAAHKKPKKGDAKKPQTPSADFVQLPVFGATQSASGSPRVLRSHLQQGSKNVKK